MEEVISERCGIESASLLKVKDCCRISPHPNEAGQNGVKRSRSQQELIEDGVLVLLCEVSFISPQREKNQQGRESSLSLQITGRKTLNTADEGNSTSFTSGFNLVLTVLQT